MNLEQENQVPVAEQVEGETIKEYALTEDGTVVKAEELKTA